MRTEDDQLFIASSYQINLWAEHCLGVTGGMPYSCTRFEYRRIDNSVPGFLISITGPPTRKTGVEGTWSANISDPGTSTPPYTYQWSGLASRTGTSVTGAGYTEAPYSLYLVVTDAHGLQSNFELVVYVCDDVC